MSWGQLRIQAGAQAPERVSMVFLEVELLGEQTIHGFNDLPYGVEHLFSAGGDLLFLICAAG